VLDYLAFACRFSEQVNAFSALFTRSQYLFLETSDWHNVWKPGNFRPKAWSIV